MAAASVFQFERDIDIFTLNITPQFFCRRVRKNKLCITLRNVQNDLLLFLKTYKKDKTNKNKCKTQGNSKIVSTKAIKNMHKICAPLTKLRKTYRKIVG
jgi:hypothetical protein